VCVADRFCHCWTTPSPTPRIGNQVFTVDRRCHYAIVAQVCSVEIGRNVKCLSVHVGVCACLIPFYLVQLNITSSKLSLSVYRRAADYLYNYDSIFGCVLSHFGCAIVPILLAISNSVTYYVYHSYYPIANLLNLFLIMLIYPISRDSFCSPGIRSAGDDFSSNV